MRWIKTLFLIFSTIFFQLITPVYAASTITRDEKIQLHINNDASALVKIERTVSLRGASWLVLPANGNEEVFSICAPVEKSMVDLSKKAMTVRWNGAHVSNFYLEHKDHCYFVHVPYLESLGAYAKAYITISFHTTIFSKKVGGVLEVLYPGFNKNTKFKSVIKTQVGTITRYYTPTLEIYIPKGFGPVASAIPSAKYATNSGQYIFRYKYTDLIDQSIRITVGSKRYVLFKIETVVNKTNADVPEFLSKYVANQVDLILPKTDTIYGQSVVFTNISPLPEKVWTDAEGNLWASFMLDATKDSKIIIEGLATIAQKHINLDLCRDKTTQAIPIENKEYVKYIESSPPFWDTHNEMILKNAKKLMAKNYNIYTTLKNDMKFVSSSLKYQRGAGFSNVGRKGASAALLSGSGVCMEFSDLLITLLRAQGIPARAAVGNAVGYLIDEASRIYGHQWVEVYCPVIGWVPVDPTWSSERSLVIGQDLDHFFHYRVANSNDFSAMLCKTYDFVTKGGVCRNYKLTVHETNTAPAHSSMYIPAEGLAAYVQAKVKKKGKVNNYIREVGASAIGRVIFTIPGVYVFLGLIAVLIINLVLAIWRILFPRKSPGMY